MKIINDNVLHGGTFSASSASSNYPAANLDHPFLTKRFQATGQISTVTILLEASTIDSIGHGLTNATSGSIKLYTGSPLSYTLQETVTMDLTSDPCLSYTAATQDNITKVELVLETDELYLYLGGVSAGEAYEIEYPLSQLSRTLVDNSSWNQTVSGQSLSNYIQPLRSIPLTFNPSSLDDANELMTAYSSLGVGHPFFIEFFSGNRDLIPPMYGCFSSPPTDSGIGIDRTISINFQECK